MKYFLVSFLICTSTFAMEQAPAKKAINLGTLEMWSEWQPAEPVNDLEKICSDVATAYNELNQPRGYWGELIKPKPVRSTIRREDGSVQERFYCQLRVYRLVAFKSLIEN